MRHASRQEVIKCQPQNLRDQQLGWDWWALQWQDFHQEFRSFHAINWLKRVVKAFHRPQRSWGILFIEWECGIPACSLQTDTQGGSWGVWPGGSPGSHLGGSWGSDLRCLQAHTLGGTPGPHPGGWKGSRPTPRGIPGTHPGGIPACTEADIPLSPADSYCCGQYTSYWNAFLLFCWVYPGENCSTYLRYRNVLLFSIRENEITFFFAYP